MIRQPGTLHASLDPALVAWARHTSTPTALPSPESAPVLSQLRALGTEHVYADTADVEEMWSVLSPRPGVIVAEVDGNTVNQPLVRRVVDRYLADGTLAEHARGLKLPRQTLAEQLHTALCARIGNDVVDALAAGRAWEPSLQLHMHACENHDTAVALGHALRALVPGCLVKVPFLPHAPVSVLIARDLEADGVPVNLTSTFSARQVVTAALLTGAARTNVFMGRLGQGLGSDLVGEHVVLEAQRALYRLRRDHGTRTRLIVASLRRWESVVRLAGCDVFTAPCPVIGALLERAEVGRGALTSQLDTSYEADLDFSPEALTTLGRERIARLWHVEPELIEFLRAYGVSGEYAALRDGDVLARRFDEAGFGDVFYAPRPREWTALRRGKLPDLRSPLTRELALDTLYTLLADGDFDNEQDAIDAELTRLVVRAA